MGFFTVFLKNRNIFSKIKRSNVTDYAALNYDQPVLMRPCHDVIVCLISWNKPGGFKILVSICLKEILL